MKLKDGPLLLLRGSHRHRIMRLAACSILVGDASAVAAQSAPPAVAPPTREEVTRPVAPPFLNVPAATPAVASDEERAVVPSSATLSP